MRLDLNGRKLQNCSLIEIAVQVLLVGDTIDLSKKVKNGIVIMRVISTILDLNILSLLIIKLD